MSTKEKIYRGSGNVFADIGVAHPERVMARAQIMSRITALDRDVEIIIKPKHKEEKFATTHVLLEGSERSDGRFQIKHLIKRTKY